jgi:malonyl-CoA O-methyltransferase
MNAIDRRQVQRHFSASACSYDDCADVQKRVARKVANLVQVEGAAKGPMLEVGTGTGYLAELIAARYPGLRLLVSDLAHAMTRAASQRLPGAWAMDLDAAALPLATETMAYVCSASAYQWVENLPRAFGECQRVLQKGGSFIFALFGDGTLDELRGAYREALLCEGRESPDYLVPMPSKHRVDASLAAAGFEIFRVWEEVEREYHGSLASLLRCLKGVGAHNASRCRPRGLASRQVMKRLEGNYIQRFADGGRLPATYRVIYGIAGKSG